MRIELSAGRDVDRLTPTSSNAYSQSQNRVIRLGVGFIGRAHHRNGQGNALWECRM